jgi:hypothetical protein
MIVEGKEKCVIKNESQARHWWLTPVILLLRRQRSGGSQFEASPGKMKARPYLKNTQHSWQSGSSGRMPA